MAQLNLKVLDPQNAPGDLYVDQTCIDCDTCRQIAPGVFGQGGGTSFVARQPHGEAERHRALMALVACPTASIGSQAQDKREAAAAARAFPEQIDGPVHYCGYASPDSYGASSYFIERPEGNILVDSPRASGPLLKRLAEKGGVGLMFLTHRDDVADHQKFHERFGCKRVLHKADLSTGTREVEVQLEGNAPRELQRGVVAIPVPGHTRGSCALLVDDRWLFTGDHLWAGEDGRLTASQSVCWHSWDEQLRSLKRLLQYRFEWVLPGHGRRIHLPLAQLRAELTRLSQKA